MNGQKYDPFLQCREKLLCFSQCTVASLCQVNTSIIICLDTLIFLLSCYSLHYIKHDTSNIWSKIILSYDENFKMTEEKQGISQRILFWMGHQRYWGWSFCDFFPAYWVPPAWDMIRSSHVRTEQRLFRIILLKVLPRKSLLWLIICLFNQIIKFFLAWIQWHRILFRVIHSWEWKECNVKIILRWLWCTLVQN